MGWNNEKGKTHWGLVCATCDRRLGRKNLSKYMPIQEAILFERYMRETVDLESYLDWPEWLKQYAITRGNPSNTTELTELNLSPRTFNTLRRRQIKTIDELATLSTKELMKLHSMDMKGVTEIQKALEEYNEQN